MVKLVATQIEAIHTAEQFLYWVWFVDEAVRMVGWSASSAAQDRKVVETHRHIRLVRPEERFLDRQRPRVAALRAVHQLVSSRCVACSNQ